MNPVQPHPPLHPPRLRTTARHIATAAAVLFVTGCLPVALHSHYRPADITPLPAIEGNWRMLDEEDNHWTFKPMPASAAHIDSSLDVFDLAIHGDKKQSELIAVPFLLDDRVWLDLQGKDAKADLEEVFAVSLIPGHLVCQARFAPSKLTLTFMDLEWLENHIKHSPRSTPFIKSADRIILTGTTTQLQRFLRNHANNTNAFKVKIELTRQQR